MHRPRIKHCFRCEIIPEAVFLLSETNHFILRGAAYQHLLPLLDGSRSVEEIVAQLEHKVPAPDVLQALELLRRRGYITETNSGLAAEIAAFWESSGVHAETAATKLAQTTVSVTALAGLDPEPFITQLEMSGVRVVHQNGARRVVLTDDYLRPELRVLNTDALLDKRPWMLVRPVGIELTIGPIMNPGQTGCWVCLEQRLTEHRMLERWLCKRKGLSGPLVLPRAALPSLVQGALGLAAAEVARWIVLDTSATLAGKLVTINALTLEKRDHRLTRRPQCPSCGDPALVATGQLRPIELRAVAARFTSDGGHRVSTPEETLSKLEHHISPITGIIGQFHKLAGGLAVTYIANQNSAFVDDELFFVRNHQRTYSAGKGKSDAQAQMSALGEAIERYAGIFQGDEARVLAKMADLGQSAVHPNDIMLYSEGQISERERWNAHKSRTTWVPTPFDRREGIEWSPLWPLLGGPPRYAPTAVCYFGYARRRGVEFARGDSNGCASGATLEEAIFQGLMELVERDSAALWWYNRLRRPSVDFNSFRDPYLTEIEGYYRSVHRRLWALDLTSDLGIPAFVAISCRVDRNPPDIMFGLGAHLDPKVALVRAVTELNEFLPGITRISTENHEDPVLRWLEKATLEGEPYLAPDPSARPRTLYDYQQRSTGDLREDILHCARRLQEKGLETLVLDQTRPDTGLPVARVVVPGLRHFWARFAPGRLYDVPLSMGWLRRKLREDELNPTAMFF